MPHLCVGIIEGVARLRGEAFGWLPYTGEDDILLEAAGGGQRVCLSMPRWKKPPRHSPHLTVESRRSETD
jgi:hypothetical protein